MNLKTGKFTVPRPGTYFFSFAGVAEFPPSSSYSYLKIGLYLNGVSIGYSWVEESTVSFQRSPCSFQSILKLKTGDQVWMEIDWIATQVYLYDNVDHFTHFSGFLLEEEIVASL